MTGIAAFLEDYGASLAGTLLVALACALVGVHVVGRRIVLVGLALPQAAAAGIALSFLAGTAAWTGPGTLLAWSRNHDGMALLACLAAVVALRAAPGGRGRGEVRAAAAYALGGALSFLLVLATAQGAEEVRNLVSGDVLGIHGEGFRSLLLFLAPVILLHLLDHRRQAFVSFDPEMAATVGVRVGLHDALFRVSLAVAVARSVHAAGTLFVFAFLVLPAAGAMRIARSPAGVSVAAGILALTGAGAGFVAAADERLDWPVGPTATVAAFALFALCSVLGRRRT